MPLLMKCLAVPCLIALTACTSGAELDDLQHRTQLLTMENDNLKHERDALQQSLTQARADLAATEQRYADLKAADDDSRRTVADAQAKVAQSEARVTELKAQLQSVRDLIASGRIDNAEDRQAALVQLSPAPAAGAPAAPAAGEQPADEGSTAH